MLFQIFTSVLRNGGEEQYNQLLNIYETAGFPEVERNCITALAQTQDRNLLQRLFKYSIQDVSPLRSSSLYSTVLETCRFSKTVVNRTSIAIGMLLSLQLSWRKVIFDSSIFFFDASFHAVVLSSSLTCAQLRSVELFLVGFNTSLRQRRGQYLTWAPYMELEKL